MGIMRAAKAFLGELRGVNPGDPALAESWGIGLATPAGVTVTPDTAKRSPAVNAANRLLSETVATVPLDLFEKGDTDVDNRRATEQPLHGLVHDAPNPEMTSTDWRRRMMRGLLLRGNAYHRITWAGDGTPARIDPLPKGSTFPFRQEGRIWYRSGGETIAALDVLHIRGPIQEGDELEARSPVMENRELIAANIAAAEFIARFFQQGGAPKWGVSIPGEIGEEATAKIRAKFIARHSGLSNAGRFAIFERGMKPEPIGMTNQEGQVLETYRQTSADIGSRVYGIPPHLGGDSDKQSSWGTGVEQMDIGYVKHVVRPYFVGIEQALGMALLTADGRRRFKFEFNVEGLLRGDFKSRMEGYGLLIQWGICTVNEIRRRENLPPIEGGDVRMSPLNYAPADQIMDVLLKEPAAAKRALDDLRRDLATALLRTGDPA